MQLTEEQIQEREEVFFHIVNDFLEENYEVDEDYVMTEEDAYITSVILEYFEEKYKFPTLQESTLEAITNYDINTKLYEELYYILLDESIGTFVAGAAHGIKNLLAKRSVNKAIAKKEKTKAEFEKHLENPGSKNKPKYKADTLQKKFEKKDFGEGPVSGFKRSFEQEKINKAREKAEKAKRAKETAETQRKSALGKYQHQQYKTGELAKRIDTGISNIKNRAKAAINTGAARIGGILGKAVGAIS